MSLLSKRSVSGKGGYGPNHDGYVFNVDHNGAGDELQGMKKLIMEMVDGIHRYEGRWTK